MCINQEGLNVLALNINKQQQRVTSPQINAYSKQLVETKFGNTSKMKANDRLYEDYRKRQVAKEMQQKMIEQQARLMSNPSMHIG